MADFNLKVEAGNKLNEHKIYTKKKLLYPDSAYLSYDKFHYILFPPGILYEPTSLILKSSKNSVNFGDENIPLQETFKLMLPALTNLELEKQYIQRQSGTGTKYSEGGTIKDGWITARIKSFGDFSVEIDTIPPNIKAKNFSNNTTVGRRKLSWRISENESGLVDYDIYINEEWFLLKYEPKSTQFYFDPPKDLKGLKTLVIRAIDACGNVSNEKFRLTF